MSVPEPLGRHLLLELHGVSPERLTDTALLESVLRSAAAIAGATVLFAHFHGFGEGQGVTGVLLLQESHISIHTWPEHGYAAVDVFMCGAARPEHAVAVLTEGLAAKKSVVQSYSRGVGLAGELPSD
jgi:S-adenosylmethionine decarboxylase